MRKVHKAHKVRDVLPLTNVELGAMLEACRMTLDALAQYNGTAAGASAIGAVLERREAAWRELTRRDMLECGVCHERAEFRVTRLLHRHTGDAYCGTGDGATVLPKVAL